MITIRWLRHRPRHLTLKAVTIQIISIWRIAKVPTNTTTILRPRLRSELTLACLKPTWCHSLNIRRITVQLQQLVHQVLQLNQVKILISRSLRDKCYKNRIRMIKKLKVVPLMLSNLLSHRYSRRNLIWRSKLCRRTHHTFQKTNCLTRWVVVTFSSMTCISWRNPRKVSIYSKRMHSHAM